MFNSLHSMFRLAALLVSLAVATGAHAQWPASKPVRLIVPISAGGSGDIVARLLANKLSEQTGTSFVVENQVGAAGSIAASSVARASPDGHTLLMAASTFPVVPSMQATKSYDPVSDFTPIAKLVALPLVLVTHADAPYKNFEEFIAYAKSHAEKMSYATSGKGAPGHIEAERLLKRYGFKMANVPYSNAGQAMTDTMSGRVAFYFPALPAALPHIMSGKLKAIAVGSLNRADKIPEIPTLAEKVGQPDYETAVWYGVVAPAGTPRDVVNKLHAEFSRALNDPAVVQAVVAAGFQVSLASSDQFGDQIQSVTKEMGALIRELGLHLSQ